MKRTFSSRGHGELRPVKIPSMRRYGPRRRVRRYPNAALNKLHSLRSIEKTSEATFADSSSVIQRVVKGAFFHHREPGACIATAAAAAKELEGQGFRVLQLPLGRGRHEDGWTYRPKRSSPRRLASLVTALRAWGTTVMVTGDAPATAAIVAHTVGLDGAICPPGRFLPTCGQNSFQCLPASCLRTNTSSVKAFQKSGHIVGCAVTARTMRCAPTSADRHCGVDATDVAKSAAGMVLTKPGLAGM